jgi:uncharacterized protein (UPF0261 family)
MTTVVAIGTLDTKGAEYAYLAERLAAHGVEVCLVDAGTGEPVAGWPVSIGRDEVASAGGDTVRELARAGDRGAAMGAMGRGAAEVVARLYAQGGLDGVVALGGSGGTSVATAAMRRLPVGVPKLMVSTVAAGDTRSYVDGTDITMMYPVVDIAGRNSVGDTIMANAAAAIAGMAAAPTVASEAHKPRIAASMFGVTTPCVDAARARLEELGYEVLVFHATGTGGQAMEALIASGGIDGVLDITTTELADELVGGILSAGPHRAEAAGTAGLPQVVSVGALDMVNFGPPESVPSAFDGRTFHRHNPSVTLMRTTAEECAELGRRLAAKLNAASGPVTLFLPTGGISMLATPGGAFADPEADRALFEALRAGLDRDLAELVETDAEINDTGLAASMAERLHQLCAARG